MLQGNSLQRALFIKIKIILQSRGYKPHVAYCNISHRLTDHLIVNVKRGLEQDYILQSIPNKSTKKESEKVKRK